MNPLLKDSLQIAGGVCVAVAVVAMLVIHAHTPPKSLPAPQLAADAYPLYTGASWGAAHASELALGTTTLSGMEVDAAPTTNVTDLGVVFAPFEAYYRDKLMNLGWSANNALQANGPGSGITVYQKGSAQIAIIYQTVFTQGGTSSPETCPCDITLSLFSSGQ